jgi:hypothetical protein
MQMNIARMIYTVTGTNILCFLSLLLSFVLYDVLTIGGYDVTDDIRGAGGLIRR